MLKIQQPIFIVGCGRSGTTILYNLIAGHKDLAWFSNYTNEFPSKPWFSTFNSLFKIPIISKNLRKNQSKFKTKDLIPRIPLPMPSEGNNLWTLFHQLRQPTNPPLTEKDVEDADIILMKKIILKHLVYSKSTRFVNKSPRNTRRSLYLYKIFPDALFIHLIRDGRAVTNSLLRVSSFILRGWKNILSIAKLWKFEVERMLMDSEKLPKRQYLEVRYETLTEEPIRTMKHILRFCNLKWETNFEKHIKSFEIRNMNHKWRQELTSEQIKVIQRELKPLLERLGYKA